MRHVPWFLLFAMLLTPQVAHAIQLFWAGGSTDLTVSQNTQAVLVVQADSGEVTLPNMWRLQWTADSLGVQFSAFDPNQACLVDTAKVDSIVPPQTPADSAANQIKAYFCSSGSSNAATAYFLADLVAGSYGKMRVVALNPADTTQVIESNEVTFNGGIDGDYAPTILSISSAHTSATLQISAVGVGLAPVTSLSIGAPDNLWKVPLNIVSQDATSITAIADVQVLLPPAVVQAATWSGALALGDFMGDPPPPPLESSTTSDTILYVDPDPTVYPKDFALYYGSYPDPTDPTHPWKSLFHLLYIRCHCINSTGNQDTIVHVSCSSWGSPWSLPDTIITPRNGWDGQSCWAPTIQQVGDSIFVFYTGVDASGNESIGYATTNFIGPKVTLKRYGNPVLRASDCPWAYSGGTPIHFRDPFVMQDPDVVHHPGQYLLFNMGMDAASTSNTVIGVAESQVGVMYSWLPIGSYAATNHTNLPVCRAESPMVVRDSLTGAWQMFLANACDAAGYNSTIFVSQSPGDTIKDLSAAGWPQKDTLFDYVADTTDVLGWQACEHLQIGQVHYFAAYMGNGIGITRMHWSPQTQKFFFVHPSVSGVGRGPSRSGVRFYALDLRPNNRMVRFVIEVTTPSRPRLVVYDVLGRRVRVLANGRVMSGRTELDWDRKNENGVPVAAGIYFARLSGFGTVQVLHMPVIR
jgi:hypothetical protein